MNKNKIFVILGIIILVLVLFFIDKNFINKSNQYSYLSNDANMIYKHTYKNYAWSTQEHYFIIYKDGTILDYKNYNGETEYKIDKIKKEELQELKNLANKIEDNFTPSDSHLEDGGNNIKEIYNETLNKWVILSKFGDTNGKNETLNSKLIIDLVNKLEDTYLEE